MDIALTIGQFLKGDSWLHRLDPRFKIIAVVTLMIVLFLLPNITYILIALLFLIVIILSAKLPLKYIINGLKPIIFLSMFSFILQLIYTNSGTLLFKIDFNISIITISLAVLIMGLFLLIRKYLPFKFLFFILTLVGIASCFIFINQLNFTTLTLNVYNEGLLNGGFFVTRIITIVILSTLLTLTTSTIDLNSGLERVLKPFKFILPVSEISLMISLTLRFVPTLLLETNKILKAQASRGVDFAEGSLLQKVKQIITLLIPMFVVSFKRADDLACAMESRGYVIGQERSNLNVLKYKLTDYIGYVVIFALLSYTIVLKVIL